MSHLLAGGFDGGLTCVVVAMCLGRLLIRSGSLSFAPLERFSCSYSFFARLSGQLVCVDCWENGARALGERAVPRPAAHRLDLGADQWEEAQVSLQSLVHIQDGDLRSGSMGTI